MPRFTPDTAIKTVSAATDELLCEAAGLRWLAAAEETGGIRIAHVIEAARDRLVEERIKTGAPTRAAACRIGAALARMHAAGAPWWGCPPPDTPRGARGIGRALTPWAESGAAKSWGAFFAEYRIAYYVRILCDEGTFGPRETALFDRVCARLAAGDFDAPQPALVRDAGTCCARLHGDLWAGNVLYLADTDARTGGALIDPMAYGGHAETDLAMLQLFGYPYLDDVLAGYDEVSPLADGWRERVGLHQLAPLLLHCVLFGGGYVPETLDTARQYR